MSNKKLVTVEAIGSKIHSIRGAQVILDKDLAYFYGVKPIGGALPHVFTEQGVASISSVLLKERGIK